MVVSRDNTEKEFDERDALQHYYADNVVEAKESPSLDDSVSSKSPPQEATKGYISKWSFAIWTLVAIVGTALMKDQATKEPKIKFRDKETGVYC